MYTYNAHDFFEFTFANYICACFIIVENILYYRNTRLSIGMFDDPKE